MLHGRPEVINNGVRDCRNLAHGLRECTKLFPLSAFTFLRTSSDELKCCLPDNWTDLLLLQSISVKTKTKMEAARHLTTITVNSAVESAELSLHKI